MKKPYKWKVQPMPRGQYRSFLKRGWPQCVDKNENLLFSIRCSDDYYPSHVMKGEHNYLKVVVYDYREGIKDRKCFITKKTFKTLKEAKEWCDEFYKNNPEYFKIDE